MLVVIVKGVTRTWIHFPQNRITVAYNGDLADTVYMHTVRQFVMAVPYRIFEVRYFAQDSLPLVHVPVQQAQPLVVLSEYNTVTQTVRAIRECLRALSAELC